MTDKSNLFKPGNQAAKKAAPKVKKINFRYEGNEKGLWNLQAQSEGLNLSEWLRKVANDAISSEIKNFK